MQSLPGKYTTVNMAAGDIIFGDHEQLIKQVPELLENTQRAMNSGHVPTMNIAASFHAFFECLLPKVCTYSSYILFRIPLQEEPFQHTYYQYHEGVKAYRLK